MNDSELIEHLGGPTKVAEILRYDKAGGVQRVQNWLVRGIPAQVKVDHPEIFMRDWVAEQSFKTHHQDHHKAKPELATDKQEH